MEHYYSRKQKSSLKIKKIICAIGGEKFEFFTSGGIFSKDRIDKGTLVLAESMFMEKDAKVLDIGCGMGVLGIAAARIFQANVVMSDVNERAVMLARKNIKLNNVDCKIFQGSLYEKITDNDFDLVLSNPPQTAGKNICFELIEQSKNFLRKGASLQLVARHNKGGKTLSRKMQDVFGNVEVIAKKSPYFVYMSMKKENES